MKNVDLYLKNGTIITPQGRYVGNIGVKDEKIVFIDKEDQGDVKAAKTLDLTGKYVMPGAWHVHCHFRDPGFTYKEDFESGTKCAAAGGITFCIDQTNNEPAPATLDTFLSKKENVEKKAYVDFGLYGAGLHPETIGDLAKAGAIAIKVFNYRSPMDGYPYIPTLGVTDHGQLYEIYEATAKTGLMCSVHHDDSEFTRRMIFRDFVDKGRVDVDAFYDMIDQGYLYGHGMVSGLASSLYLAKLAGVRLNVIHCGVMPPITYDLIKFYKAHGVTVYAELEACALLLPQKVFKEKTKTRANCYAKYEKENWEAIYDGTITTICTEHAPHTEEEVLAHYDNVLDGPFSLYGVQEFLPLMLNEVNKGTISFEKLCYLVTESPAKLYGQYPKKGVIQVGSDADFTVVDMDKKITFTNEGSLSKSKSTTFIDMTMQGVPIYTIVRGSIVYDNGEIVGKPGFGKMAKGQAAE